MNIILGSSSPRRSKLLSLLSSQFTIVHPNCLENPLLNELPISYTKRISIEKATTIYVSKSFEQQTLIITADTIVTHDNIIYGKPTDKNDAISTLLALSGKVHTVITSICLGYIDHELQFKTFNTIEKTHVEFKQLTNQIISDYLSQINYLDKSGSYAIQDNCTDLIKNISGSLSNVVGFPVASFLNILWSSGIYKEFFNSLS